MDNYQIDPKWRVADMRVDSRRAFSPYALGFSIAVHLAIAGLLLIALVRAGEPRPSHPAYLVARIVDRLPGADGGAKKNVIKAAVIGPQASVTAITADAASEPKPAAHHLRSLRSWVEKHIAPTRIETRKLAADARTIERKIAKSEVASIGAKPPVPLEASGLPAAAKSVNQGGASANIALGTGVGAGGSGASREAHAAYGAAPAPEYPFDARRMEQQGVVTLRVLVSADGSTKRIEVARSSGFQLLDNVALETVRERWRFVPAMRDGAAVESWAMVPIRFALTEADASE